MIYVVRFVSISNLIVVILQLHVWVATELVRVLRPDEVLRLAVRAREPCEGTFAQVEALSYVKWIEYEPSEFCAVKTYAGSELRFCYVELARDFSFLKT